jgi:DDE superfamily endonuclease
MTSMAASTITWLHLRRGRPVPKDESTGSPSISSVRESLPSSSHRSFPGICSTIVRTSTRRSSPQWLRDVGHQSAWIIGAVCLARDSGAALVMTRLDSAAMNLFLVELSQAMAPGAHGIVLMGQCRLAYRRYAVRAHELSLVFLSPYSPELNPIERLWLHLRDNEQVSS